MKPILNIAVPTLLFNLAITTLNFVFGLCFLEQTGSAFVFGTLIVIGPVVSLALTPLATKIIDTYDHQKLLFYAQIGTLSCLLAYWCLVHFSKQSLISPAYFLMICVRLGEELFTVTLKATVPQIVAPAQYQQINAVLQSTLATANIAGPIIGGIIFSFLTLQTAILFISLILSIAVFWTRQLHFIPATEPRKNNGHAFRHVLHFVNTKPTIKSLVIIAMFVNFFAAAITIGLPIVVLQQLHLPKLLYSLLDSLTSIAMVTGGIFLTLHRNKDALKTVYCALFCFTVIILCFGLPGIFTQNHALIIGVLSLLVLGFGLVVVFANTAMMTYLQNQVPEHQQGGVYAIINGVSQLFVPLGALGYGFLFDVFKSQYVFFISGVLAFTIIITLLRQQKTSYSSSGG